MCKKKFVIFSFTDCMKKKRKRSGKSQMNKRCSKRKGRGAFEAEAGVEVNSMCKLTIYWCWASKNEKKRINSSPLVQLKWVYLTLTNFQSYIFIALNGKYWVCNLLGLKSFMWKKVKRLWMSLIWIQCLSLQGFPLTVFFCWSMKNEIFSI